jgi:hypothetical protein
MGVLGQRRRRDRADSKCRAVWRLELGMCALERLELAEETVILRVRDLRCVVDVVGVVGALDLLAQAGYVLGR